MLDRGCQSEVDLRSVFFGEASDQFVEFIVWQRAEAVINSYQNSKV